MKVFGVNLNYKKEHRISWICCTTIFILSLSILISSFINYSDYEESYAILNLIEFCGSGLLQNVTVAAPIIAYITLLRNLHKRFAILNELFRFLNVLFHKKMWEFGMKNQFGCFFYVLIRNQFCNGDTLKFSISIRKEDSIDFIKFIGRQHSYLIAIMDLINFCYSIQVIKINFIINVIIFCCLFCFWWSNNRKCFAFIRCWSLQQ